MSMVDMAGPFLLFDLGGTKMRVALSRDGSALDEIKSVPTPARFDEGVDTLLRVARELLGPPPAVGGASTPVAVVGGIGWVLDKSRSHIFRSTKANLLDWNDKPLRGELEKRFNAPVRLENDCVLAALGEAVVGAGKGHEIVAYYTVSTGVGGARVVHGIPDSYASGFEPGKQLIDDRNLEEHVSGTAVQKKYGVHPKDLADLDKRSELAKILARGVHNAIVHWSPEMFVFGGSMMIGVNPLPLDVVEAALKSTLSFYPELPALSLAALGDDGGLHGARILASKTV